MFHISVDTQELTDGIFYKLLSARSDDASDRVKLVEHSHRGFSEIMIVLHGSLRHRSGNAVKLMTTGDLFFLPDGSAHQLSEPSADLLMLNLCVLPSFTDETARFLRIESVPIEVTFSHVETGVTDFLLTNHKLLMETNDVHLRTPLMRSAYTVLLPYCCTERRQCDWFEDVLFQMEKQENLQAGIHRFQELAFCTPEHLSRVCRSRIGMTPTDYINDVRIRYACNLLRMTSKSIQDVSMECGYSTLSYFYRCFTQKTGMSPKQYRKNPNADISDRP